MAGQQHRKDDCQGKRGNDAEHKYMDAAALRVLYAAYGTVQEKRGGHVSICVINRRAYGDGGRVEQGAELPV